MQDQPRRDSTLKTKKWAKASSPANLSAPASVIELESSTVSLIALESVLSAGK